ncbi:MAG: thioredoxin family protein [Duodenibacillus sp.]|jgi:thioredoxin (trx)|nr:thioredoxin family protein [Duodenibacillus sp.]
MDTSAMTFVTDETFDEVVGKSALPVLFVMGATWCPDCQRIAPLMMMLAKENAGKILFAHADFDSAQGLKERFHVRSIPTLFIIRNGQVLDTLVEPKAIAPVKAFLQKAL